MKNLVILVGRVGKEPDIRNTENGSFATFPLATTERYKDRNGNKQENTEWHNIKLNGDKLAQYIKKGDLLVVQGKIHTTKKNDKYYTNIIGREVSFVPTGKSNQSQSSQPSSVNEANTGFDQEKGNDLPSSEEEDDLPF